MTAQPASPALEVPEAGVRRALVLSGGGARGAYEAGVLSFLHTDLAAELGHAPRFDVICGSSVGAVNACHTAAYAHDPQAGAHHLVRIWSELSFGDVYSFGARDALRFAGTLLGFARGSSVEPELTRSRIHGLLDTTPLERLVVEQVPWRQLRRNLRRGGLEALCLSATEIASGRTVIFVDHHQRAVPTWTHDELIVARAARIGAVHALASGAIPFLFPAVRIGSTYYADGGLRQHSPLSPALRLGANRVLAIGLRHKRVRADSPHLQHQRLERFRSAGFLLGKVLNTLLSDRLEVDLGHMRVINRMLWAGLEGCDPDFLERVNTGVAKERGLGFQIVDDCLIKPSRDIGAIAASHVERLQGASGYSALGRTVFKLLTSGSPSEEADLMSYLLFDGAYAAELVALGRADAAAQREELLSFFSS